MNIYLGSDHAGFNLKNNIETYLKQRFEGDEASSALDLGVFTNDSTDYPEIAREVCEKVLENHGALGILVCGSGVGMSIAANRRRGIRAVLASSEEMARTAREHNNANILCLGERFISEDLAKKIVDAFLESSFPGVERHVRRVEQLDKLEQGQEKDEKCGSC